MSDTTTDRPLSTIPDTRRHERRTVLRATLLLLSLTLPGVLAAAAIAAPPPNVVVIVADDLGWPDLGFSESSRTILTNQGTMPVQDVVQTPNLDALADSGVRFRNGYNSASVCRPSLQTVLSAGGLPPAQWGLLEQRLEGTPGVGTIPSRAESQYYRTLPRELARIGYQSWEGGKMWEGTFATAGFTHGLATSIGGPLQMIGEDFGRKDWSTTTCGSTAAPGSVCPALAPLRDFLDEASGSPFFLWVAPELPHPPITPPLAYRQPYLNLGLTSFQVTYLGAITWLDQIVGEVLGELEDRDLLDDTLVVFFSDNGWGLGFQTLAGQGKGKGTLYDIGFKTPVLLSWPGRIPAGVVHDDLVSLSDLPATILDYAGADPVPEQRGVSLRDRIEGGPPLERSEVIGLHPGLGSFLRSDGWHYMRFQSDGHEELYRVDVDPFEMVDLASSEPALLQDFRVLVDDWIAAQNEPAPVVEIVGRLADPDDNPIVGARVRVAGSSLNAVVGMDGSFRIGPLTPSSYGLMRQSPITGLTGLGAASVIPVPANLTAFGLHIPVTAKGPGSPRSYTGRIDGLLETDTGAPLPGRVVRVRGRLVGGGAIRLQVLTGPDGRYRAENLAPGSYRISASVPTGYRSQRVSKLSVEAESRYTVDLVAFAD